MPARIAARPPGPRPGRLRSRRDPAAPAGSARPSGGSGGPPVPAVRRRRFGGLAPAADSAGPGPVKVARPARRAARDFGPPAPPKGKKGAKPGFKKDENRPRGPIPTKFTGRMYDLDDVEKEEEGDDIVPDFMKPDTDTDGPDEPDDGGGRRGVETWRR